MRFSIRTLGAGVNRIYNHNNQIVGQTVYLTHVKWVTGKGQLENYFSKYGTVRSVNMFFDADTGLHRGFASVTFDSNDSATRAMQQRPHVIDGDRVDLEPYLPLVSKKRPDVQM